MEEILEFFDKAEAVGQSIPAEVGPQVDLGEGNQEAPNTIAYEARQLKYLYLRLYNE